MSAEPAALEQQQTTVAEHPALADWPEPVNLFKQFVAAPFTADLLPAELARYPAAHAEGTGIDPGIALVSAVVAAASAIDDRIQICGNSNSAWFQQARLWALVIAEPGGGKTPTQRAMIEPLFELHKELNAEWQREAERIRSQNPKDRDPTLPPLPRVVVSDTTTEALSEVLRDNPRGVLVANDEFDAWLGALDQYRGGGVGTRDRGEWLRIFDGGPAQIERVKRGSVFIPNWSASILSATTPAAIGRLARALPSDGLIQRFIVVCARRRRIVQESEDARHLERARAEYRETIRRLWAVQPRAHNGVVQLSLDARRLFEAWRVRTLAEQEAFGSIEPALESHMAKHETLLLRVALTFHVARVVNLCDPRSRDPAAWTVPADTLERAIAFMRRVADHALAFYLGRQGGSEAYELARHIARFILAKSAPERARGLQRRDLLRGIRAFRDAEPTCQAVSLRLLADLGWIRESEGIYEKAQPTHFEINPRLMPLFTAESEAERERRALVRERIAESIQARRNDAAGP